MLIAMITVAIVGLGQWGKNHLRVLSALSGVQVKWICGRKKETLTAALTAIAPSHPPQITTKYPDLLKDRDLQAIVIVTPAATHYELTKAALLAGKDVLVEKPFTLSLAEAEELVRIAEERGRILMVGHIHYFNPAIEKLRADIAAGTLGTIREISAVQFHNEGKRSDAGVLWDMFPHPLAILDDLIVEQPREVSANGDAKRVSAALSYPSGIHVTLIGDWTATEKSFRIAFKANRTVVFDDYAAEKLKYAGVVQRAPGESSLTAELRHFLDCVKDRQEPKTSGKRALRVMRVLDALERSLRTGTLVRSTL